MERATATDERARSKQDRHPITDSSTVRWQSVQLQGKDELYLELGANGDSYEPYTVQLWLITDGGKYLVGTEWSDREAAQDRYERVLETMLDPDPVAKVALSRSELNR